MNLQAKTNLINNLFIAASIIVVFASGSMFVRGCGDWVSEAGKRQHRGARTSSTAIAGRCLVCDGDNSDGNSGTLCDEFHKEKTSLIRKAELMKGIFRTVCNAGVVSGNPMATIPIRSERYLCNLIESGSRLIALTGIRLL